MINDAVIVFFFNDTATTEIYTLSLHDALPILAHPVRPGTAPCRDASRRRRCGNREGRGCPLGSGEAGTGGRLRGTKCSDPDRKSTRLNSSHANISYAVFCLKKKKIILIIYSIH